MERETKNMKQQAVEMDFLYRADVVKEDFSKEKLLQFLQNDQIYPIKGSVKQYKKYEQIILESEAVEETFFIVSGYIMATKGNKRVVGFYTEEDVIGLEDLMLNSQSHYSFEAISDEVSVIRYDKGDIIEKNVKRARRLFLSLCTHAKLRPSNDETRTIITTAIRTTH